MHAIMEEITDHQKDDSAAPTWDGMIAQEGCLERPKITAKGWELLVQWKDGSSSWEKLKDLKVSNLIEVAKHAVANWIANEPAFAWWVPQVPCKWNWITSKVKSKCWQMTHKFGVQLPHSVEEALQIDADMKTDCWQKALNKEMSKVKVAWRWHDGCTPDDMHEVEGARTSSDTKRLDATLHSTFT